MTSTSGPWRLLNVHLQAIDIGQDEMEVLHHALGIFMDVVQGQARAEARPGKQAYSDPTAAHLQHLVEAYAEIEGIDMNELSGQLLATFSKQYITTKRLREALVAFVGKDFTLASMEGGED
jgi:hypothetical protein